MTHEQAEEDEREVGQPGSRPGGREQEGVVVEDDDEEGRPR